MYTNSCISIYAERISLLPLLTVLNKLNHIIHSAVHTRRSFKHSSHIQRNVILLHGNERSNLTSQSIGCSKKLDTCFIFCDNFGKSTLILTTFSLLQQEMYEAK